MTPKTKANLIKALAENTKISIVAKPKHPDPDKDRDDFVFELYPTTKTFRNTVVTKRDNRVTHIEYIIDFDETKLKFKRRDGNTINQPVPPALLTGLIISNMFDFYTMPDIKDFSPHWGIHGMPITSDVSVDELYQAYRIKIPNTPLIK